MAPITEFRPVQNLAVDKLAINDYCQIVRDTYARYVVPGDDMDNTTCFSNIPLVTSESIKESHWRLLLIISFKLQSTFIRCDICCKVLTVLVVLFVTYVVLQVMVQCITATLVAFMITVKSVLDSIKVFCVNINAHVSNRVLENKPVPAERVIAYYETTIVCGGWNKLIGVGFANKKVTNDLLGLLSCVGSSHLLTLL